MKETISCRNKNNFKIQREFNYFKTFLNNSHMITKTLDFVDSQGKRVSKYLTLETSAEVKNLRVVFF